MRKRLLIGGALLALATGAQARVTAIHIDSRTPVKGERPYEIITGTFDGDVSPTADAIITDIAHAPRNARGRVGYNATFAIARPLTGGSGVLFYDVPNRGNGKVAPDEDGHIRVISGWQGDLTPAQGVQTITVPVAKGLTGLALARVTDLSGGTWGLTGGIGRPVARPLPVDLNTAHAHLYAQSSDEAALKPILADQWAFADCRNTPSPARPIPRASA
jgi:hypothetical protein